MPEVKNHTDLLNYIARKINAKSYLEIGVANGRNFNQIAVAHKVGVDPDLNTMSTVHKTSDDFFYENREVFDLVFVDGMHEESQVKKDILNAWIILSERGVVVVHDCNPEKEEITHVPRDSKIWCGDVYKTAVKLNAGFTIDMDYGCLVLRKKLVGEKLEWSESEEDVPWGHFERNRKELLGLVTIEEGQKIIDSWT